MTNWTTADIPDQTGRTAVITGANTGLGYETAAALAAKGAARRARRTQPRQGQGRRRRIAKPLRTPTSRCRTSTSRSLESVRAAADELRSAHDRDRPADQQRRRDVHAEGRPPRTASSCSSAPTISATSPSPACCSTECSPRRFAGGHGQQHGPSHRGESTSTTCSGKTATAESAPTGSRSSPTCCSPTNCSGGWSARTPSPWPPTRAARVPSWPATCPAGAVRSRAAHSPGRRHGRAADAARGHRSRRARRAVLRTRRLPRAAGVSEGRGIQRPFPRRRRCSAGCGRSPRN